MPRLSTTKRSAAGARKKTNNVAASSQRRGPKGQVLDSEEDDDDTIGLAGPTSTAHTQRPTLCLKWSCPPFSYSPSDANRASNAHLDNVPASIAALTNADLMQVLDSGIAFISSASDIPPSLSFAVAALPTRVDERGNLSFLVEYRDKSRGGDSYDPLGVLVDAKGVLEKPGMGEDEEGMNLRELLCKMVKEREGFQGAKVIAPSAPRMQAVWWGTLGKRVPCLTLTWMVAVEEGCTVEFFN